eukprot:COSAG02_NODE_6538_length_3509_cov_31.003603_1_plen_136_part_00
MEHYAAAVVLDMNSAEAHFQLSHILLREAFEQSPPPAPSATATMTKSAARELSHAAELLCERCVASAAVMSAAARECECVGSTPRGRALSLLVAGDAGNGLLEGDEVLAAIERELQIDEHAREYAHTPTEGREEL